MPGSFSITGFSDLFQQYAREGHPIAQDRVVQCNGNTLRFGVYWDEVEPAPGTYDWHLYEDVGAQAADRGLKVLPILLGVPGWADPVPNGFGGAYPRAEAATAFAEFAYKVVEFYSNCGVLRAVEVWNEPNLSGHPSFMPPETYGGLLGAVLHRIKSSGPYTGVTVLGASVAFVSGWQSYLQTIRNQCHPWSLSIHPYSTQNSADGVSAEVLSKFDQVTNITGAQDVWVTETGCGLSDILGVSRQGEALKNIIIGLAHFRPQCKAMLVYRLRPHHLDNGTPFVGYPILNGDANWTPRPSFNTLQQGWP